MKRIVQLCLTLILLNATTLAFAGSKNHNHKAPQPKYEGVDSTKHTKPQEKKGHDGGSQWTVVMIVNDATAKPIPGATVSAPCTGQPSKTTDATGKVVFSGNAPCPCAESQATVTTTKGCNKNVNVSCGNTYTVVCP
jgi:hypothetical protein